MPYPSALSAAAQARIRGGANFQRYLIIHTGTIQFAFHPSVAASGKSNAQITYSATLSGSRLNCLLGMTVFITPSSDYVDDLQNRPEDCLITYIRKTPTSTILYIGETAFQWNTSHFVTVLDEWRVHEKRVRVAGNVIYKNYDVTLRPPLPRIYDLSWDIVTTESPNANYSPTPLAEAMASGASISTWRWDVIENGVVSLNASTSQNPTFNLDVGTHWLYLTVTDNAGQTNWFAQLVAVVPESFASVVNKAIVRSLTYDLVSGNSAQMDKIDDSSAIVPGSPCMVITRTNYLSSVRDTVVSLAGWLGGEVQLSLTGDAQFGRQQSLGDSIKGARQVSETIRLVAFPLVEKSPSLWGDVSRLTVYDAIWYIGSEHSTLFNVAACELPSDHTSYRFPEIQTPAGTLTDILDSLAARASFGLVNYCPTGELFFRKSLLYETSASDRNAATIYATYSSQEKDAAAYNVKRNAPGVFAFNAVLGGFGLYNTTTRKTRIYESLAPAGFVPLALMEKIDSIIMEVNLSDTAAKAEAGAITANHLFAASEATQITLDLIGGYVQVFPSGFNWHKADIPATDLLDGSALTTSERLICTSVSSQYDGLGAITNSATFRKETDGGSNYANHTQYVPLLTEQAYPTYPVDQLYPLSDFDDLELSYGPGIGGQREGWTDPTEPQEEAVENQQSGPGVVETLYVSFMGGAVGTSFNTQLGVNYLCKISNDAIVGNSEDDSFSLPSTTSGFTSSNINTITGVDYIVRVTGHVARGNPQSTFRTDAQWVTLDGFVSNFTRENFIDFQGFGAIDADNSIYNAAHIYEFTRPGTGSPIVIRYKDSAYGDNAGNFTVDIFGVGQIRGDAFFWKYNVGEAVAYAAGKGLNKDGSGIVHGESYSSEHTYELTFAGTGNPFTFTYIDPESDYSNNENRFIKVEIIQI